MTTAVHDPSASSTILVPIKRIARSLNFSVATINKLVAKGDFPKPIDLGVRKKQFILSQVEQWWRTRLGGMNGHAFPLAPEHPDDNK